MKGERNQHVKTAFFGVRNHSQFVAGINQAIQALSSRAGLFAGDNLITFGKNLSFLTDSKFMEAFDAHAETPIEQGIIWRIYTVAWAARHCMRLEGDLVECACYKGTTARIVSDYVDLVADPNRRYFLYDLFDHDAAMPHHAMPEHSSKLLERVRRRFIDLPNVVVTPGRVPDSLQLAAPEKIAFLHLDLNNAEAEIGVLQQLFDRMTPGALLVLDDYGWRGYRHQKLAEDEWFSQRGYSVLELPTGQGLVIK